MNAALPLPDPCPSSSDVYPITDEWLQWIAESKLRGCTVESMLETMAGAGLSQKQSQTAIAAMDDNPVFRAALRFQQLQRKLESVLSNQQKLWASAPDYDQIERRAHISTDEFMQRFVRGCRPLILTGVAQDWPAMQRWSPEYLKTQFGHLNVEIQAERSADPRYEANKTAHRRQMNLGQFVDQVCSGGITNDYYLTANNELLRRPEFASLLDDIGTLPPFCNRDELAQRASFWFGPAGTKTSLHHDTLMLLHTQIVGRKRWRLISPLETPRLYNHFRHYSPVDLDQPDVYRYPDIAHVRVLDVTVHPGETMFLPLCWWHQVNALDISLSFSYSNLAIPNQFEYQNPEIYDW